MSWIKMETHTPDKPEIFEMAEKLSIDPDLVFAKCFRIWAWFDAHTTNGKTNGSGVSELLVDRISGVTGFAKVMLSVGWLATDSTGLTLPNFDRHNGETAKGRALTAKRVAKHANGKTNGSSVSSSLPREDKNIKEINKENNSKKTSLPENFSISDRVQSWATEKGFSNIEKHLENFIWSCKAKGYKYVDWDAAFMNAIRTDWAKINSSDIDNPFAGAI